MRVLALTHYWLPHPGGIETAAREHLRRLAGRGHAISIVTSEIPRDARPPEDDGLAVYRVPAWNPLERISVPYPIFAPRLFRVLSQLVPTHDVVLSHGHTFLTSVAAAAVTRRKKKPFVLYQHNPFVEYSFPLSQIQRGADLLLGKYVLRSADRVLAGSKYAAAYVSALAPGSKIEILGYGVDTSRFKPAESQERRLEIRKRLNLPAEGFVVFSLRRLVPHNGLDTLMDACLRLRDHADILFIVGGSGPEAESLARFVVRHGLQNVRLEGFVPEEELPDYYRASDAFVLPARIGEGFGLVLLDALASGIPVIAVRGGRQDQMICEARAGLLVSPASPDELANAVLTLRNSPETNDAPRAARAVALQHDWEITTDRLEEILLQAAGMR